MNEARHDNYDLTAIDDYFYDMAKANIWVTNEGIEIPITEMSNRHLLNSYNLILREGECHNRYIFHNQLKRELLNRGLI